MFSVTFRITGSWAHFRRPETNNTPLTHDFLTKTAAIGMVAAVLGMERASLRQEYPKLCSGLIYGLVINSAVRKRSCGFTMRNATEQSSTIRTRLELLREPDYTVMLAATDPSLSDLLSNFAQSVQLSRCIYDPVMGLQNCPAELSWISDGEVNEFDGTFTAKCFVTRENHLINDFSLYDKMRLGFDRIPTFQDENWTNDTLQYVNVVYTENNAALNVSGKYYEALTGEKWCLI